MLKIEPHKEGYGNNTICKGHVTMIKIEPLSCLSVADREKRMRSFLLKGSRFDIWEQIKEEKIKTKSIVDYSIQQRNISKKMNNED
ncbi:MAG: hypothetical protein Q7J10_09560 [Methanosarcinaceae archaeon]|nr:hypothetical protein [Methanosarcinaceae archaeon]